MEMPLLKIRFIPIVVFTLTSSCLYSQQEKIDSLKLIIENSPGIDKYDPMISLVRVYAAAGNNVEALRVVSEANQIAYNTGDTSRIVTASRIMGQLFNRMNEHKEAERILLQVLPLAERNNAGSDHKKILSNLAIAYTYQAKYDLALDVNFQALALREQDRDDKGLSISLNNIGVVYYKLKDFRRALRYFKQSVELKMKLKDNYDLDLAFINIGHCYACLEDFSKAKWYIKEGLKICGNNCHVKRLIEADFAMGLVYFGLKDPVRAESYFLKSYTLAKEVNDDRFQFDNIDYLSQIYIQRNQITKAAEYLDAAEALIDQGSPHNLERIKIYSRFIQLYSQQKDFKKTASYQQKYIRLKDSIYDEELTTNLMKVEADFLEKENKDKIAAQNQILALKEEGIRHQKLLNAAVSSLAVILIVLAMVLFKNNRQKRRMNQLLEVKVRERTRELEINRNNLLTACEERDLLLEKTGRNIKSALVSIKGICRVGLQDTASPDTRQYLAEIEASSEALSGTLRVLQYAERG